MLHKLPYDTLYQVYQDSIKFSLDKEFIELLEAELKRRGVPEPRTSPPLPPSTPEAADFAAL